MTAFMTPFSRIFCLLVPLILISCKKPEITYYEVPRESDPVLGNVLPANHPPISTGSDSNADMTGPAMANLIPQPDMTKGVGLKWTPAEHWVSGRSSSMRLASYTLPDNPALDISITRFPGDVGGLLSNVNRWRGQVGLAPTDDETLQREMEIRDIREFHFRVIHLTNEDSMQKMLVALLLFDGNTWFFKMMGPGALVDTEESNFFSMLDSLTTEQ